MGAACARGVGKEPSDNIVQHPKRKPEEAPDRSRSASSIHSAEEILDDDFKAQITDVINGRITTIHDAYQVEHARIVNEMESLAPERYLGLLFSEYPDVNGSTVNEMARRLVTSAEARQQLTDQVNDHMQPSFLSRTANWKPATRETARPIVRTFIENHVNDAFDRVELA